MYYNNKSHDLQIIICSSVDNESIIKKMIKKKLLAMCLSPDRGGLELYFLKFIDYYTQRNTEVHVICSDKSYITKIHLRIN